VLYRLSITNFNRLFLFYLIVLFLYLSEYMCHVYVRGDSLAGVLISDHEYPNRVSHTLITKVLDEFQAKYPAQTWSTLKEGITDFQQVNVYLAKYQNPCEADSLTKMQQDLDETKIIIVSFFNTHNIF
jgi:synaptobrevin family protein YKT6